MGFGVTFVTFWVKIASTRWVKICYTKTTKKPLYGNESIKFYHEVGHQ